MQHTNAGVSQGLVVGGYFRKEHEYQNTFGVNTNTFAFQNKKHSKRSDNV